VEKIVKKQKRRMKTHEQIMIAILIFSFMPKYADTRDTGIANKRNSISLIPPHLSGETKLAIPKQIAINENNNCKALSFIEHNLRFILVSFFFRL
jgi:hypothetical protein